MEIDLHKGTQFYVLKLTLFKSKSKKNQNTIWTNTLWNNNHRSSEQVAICDLFPYDQDKTKYVYTYLNIHAM